jgi:apolipoprotein N-acyltransferase
VFTTTIVAGIFILGFICRLLILMPDVSRGQRVVSIFQPAVPQNEKLDDTASNRIKHMIIDQVRLYSQERKTELIVMPETLVPEFLLQDKGFMFSLRDAVDATVIFGTPRFKNRSVNNDYFNSVVLMNKFGDITPLHDKKYLVPFGEYVPYRSLLYWLIAPTGFLETEYAAGEDNQSTAGYASAICFESTLPYQLREQVNSGGKLIIVITNDAWYKKTEMLEIHLACAVFRAVENNRYLLQAANTGVSAIIDNHGRIVGRSQLDARQWLEGTVELQALPTPYTLLGETTVYISWIIVAIMGYVLLLTFVNKPK